MPAPSHGKIVAVEPIARFPERGGIPMRRLVRAIAELIRDTINLFTFRRPSQRG
jgi:hypothetical protein